MPDTSTTQKPKCLADLCSFFFTYFYYFIPSNMWFGFIYIISYIPFLFTYLYVLYTNIKKVSYF